LEAAFRALYLNQRIDAEARFISTEDWSACGAKFDPEQLRGAECWAGLDLSSTNDLSALVLYFPVTGAVLPFFWVPKENLNIRSERDRVPYDVWARQGHVMTTEGKSVDRRAIAKKMAEITMRYSLRGVGYDRWRMEDLRHILDEEGITIPLLPFGQGYADMAPAVDALEILILNGGLKHGGNPVLRWNASNVVVTLDPAGNRKLDKSKSRERIDGIVALAMAVGVHAKSGKKEYNSRILEL
jgi:phage terminase large subunit-like protein